MNWIKISEQKPPNREWVLLGRIRAHKDDPKHPILTVCNFGEYREKEDKYYFALQLDVDGESPIYNIGVMMKRVFGEFFPNEATHWMKIPLIDE
jgi:hypothetical protein